PERVWGKGRPNILALRGCPITTALRRPRPNPSSPPHDTVPPDGPVVDLVLPDVILSSQPIPGWAGGQRTYGITTATTDLDAASRRAARPARGTFVAGLDM